MKRISFKMLLTVIAGVFLLGCYPDGPDYTEDLDVVYTTYNDTYDFGGQATYAMPNKIVIDIEIDNADTTYVYMKDAFAKPILDAIDANMSQLGWVKADISTEPDVVLTPGVFTNTTYFYSYWYDWWYGGWYGGWYGWYYPPYYTVSSYTTGSLIIALADPTEDTPTGRNQAKWLSVANGLYSGAYDVDRVLKTIDQAFAQSPYLKTN
jgi:hypothetical protein